MGVEALANYYLINTNTSLSNKVKNDTAGKKRTPEIMYIPHWMSISSRWPTTSWIFIVAPSL